MLNYLYHETHQTPLLAAGVVGNFYLRGVSQHHAYRCSSLGTALGNNPFGTCADPDEIVPDFHPVTGKAIVHWRDGGVEQWISSQWWQCPSTAFLLSTAACMWSACHYSPLTRPAFGAWDHPMTRSYAPFLWFFGSVQHEGNYLTAPIAANRLCMTHPRRYLFRYCQMEGEW